jgi:hypothetical protein
MEPTLKSLKKLEKKICLFLERESKEYPEFRKNFMREREDIWVKDSRKYLEQLELDSLVILRLFTVF